MPANRSSARADANCKASHAASNRLGARTTWYSAGLLLEQIANLRKQFDFGARLRRFSRLRLGSAQGVHPFDQQEHAGRHDEEIKDRLQKIAVIDRHWLVRRPAHCQLQISEVDVAYDEANRR